jgi:hypothetical protein
MQPQIIVERPMDAERWRLIERRKLTANWRMTWRLRISERMMMSERLVMTGLPTMIVLRLMRSSTLIVILKRLWS